MIVYHWTTEENAKLILQNGLRQDSFICRNPEDWEGEVCLQVDTGGSFTWDGREEPYDWQAITEFIEPQHIRKLGRFLEKRARANRQTTYYKEVIMRVQLSFYYEGEINEKLDDHLKGLAKEIGFEWYAQGQDLDESSRRDIAFEAHFAEGVFPQGE